MPRLVHAAHSREYKEFVATLAEGSTVEVPEHKVRGIRAAATAMGYRFSTRRKRVPVFTFTLHGPCNRNPSP